VWACRKCGEKLLDAKVEKLKKPIKGLKYYGLYLTLGGAFWVVFALASGAFDEIFFALGILAVGLLMFIRGRTDNSRRR
jgi:hypothetical protein